MKVDLTGETLITFAKLANRLPHRRRDRPVHVSTIFRWRNPGLRGLRLEAVRVGAAWATSLEAFARFCARLSALEDAEVVIPRVHQGREDDVERELSDEGL